MGSLLLVVYTLINPVVVETRAALETPGKWAIVVTWPVGDNDVDIWLRDPTNRLVWWNAPRSPLAHLEQDDVGLRGDQPNGDNLERMVLRNVAPGEFVANLHCYACYATPVHVTVTLWRLQGADKKVYSTKATLRNHEEVTAFRFSLDSDGRLTDRNDLPIRLVSA